MAPFTLIDDALGGVAVPESGIAKRVIFESETLKIVAFRFSAGHEMPVHSTPSPALLQFLQGEAEVVLGEERRIVDTGALIHMSPALPHGIFARTPVSMLLWLFKQPS